MRVRGGRHTRNGGRASHKPYGLIPQASAGAAFTRGFGRPEGALGGVGEGLGVGVAWVVGLHEEVLKDADGARLGGFDLKVSICLR
jgi:hypothetical protein